MPTQGVQPLPTAMICTNCWAPLSRHYLAMTKLPPDPERNTASASLVPMTAPATTLAHKLAFQQVI
tara:strand:- start:1953 stop:2150 length:198 start_codon:yes stop_codon:yes gene_type:complete